MNHLRRKVKAGANDGQAMAVVDMTQGNLFHLCVSAGCGDAFFNSYQIAKEGMEVEIEIAEFAEASEPATEENLSETCLVDPEYEKITAGWSSEEYQLQRKLERFRMLEAILKEEGVI